MNKVPSKKKGEIKQIEKDTTDLSSKFEKLPDSSAKKVDMGTGESSTGQTDLMTKLSTDVQDLFQKLIKQQEFNDKITNLIIFGFAVLLATVGGLIVGVLAPIYWNYHTEIKELKDEKYNLLDKKIELINKNFIVTPTFTPTSTPNNEIKK